MYVWQGLCIVAGAQSIYDFLGTLSLRCNGVPTASQTAAVEIMYISAEQKWSLFLGCREASFSLFSGKRH